MKHISQIKNNIFFQDTSFNTRREELISRLTKGINNERQGTKYPPTTEATIAIKANMNPSLKKDGELELLIKECEEKGNYKKFWWVVK